MTKIKRLRKLRININEKNKNRLNVEKFLKMREIKDEKFDKEKNVI
jgi:hypothetical protein